MISFPDIDWHAIAPKVRQSFDVISTTLFLALRDQDGNINWSSIIQAALTAGLIASITTLLQLNNKVTELQAIQQLRSPVIEQLPAVIVRQDMVLQRLQALESGNASATSERFRQSDGVRLRADMEQQLQREINRIEQRIDREQRWKGKP